ncbi:BlaZ family class A beta-lactamase [Staphylococcus casei]|uniref:class A beta-lactamase n=1 Tax=Staphylococcus TaxID=1279 RepID=UPI000CD1AB1E|nr:class A beta-lactamase [Staphylococcus casei]PNZ63930.1 BlaZ family class A beta-lactamase [Staphylococcus casei]WJE86049.1 class A beta-lactamase [Staphylococcus casei]
MKKILYSALICLSVATLSSKVASANEFDQLEKENSTTVGVYGINTESGEEINHHSDERFGYASTFKAIASGVLLNNYTEKELNKKIQIQQKDIVAYSPVTEKYVGKQMSLKALIEAAMLKSDNTANNYIIGEIGGISSFKAALQQLGDHVSDPQRLEPKLNDYEPTSTADTTTPRAAAHTLNELLTSHQMNTKNLKLLKRVMIENETGDQLIKAGVPKHYLVGDKSGQGTTYATRNDIAFIYPKKDDKPIILAVYTKKDDKEGTPDDKVIAKAAQIAIKQIQ